MKERFACYVGDGVALTTTSLDHKMYVDTEDTCCSPHIMVDGDWERWISQFLITNRVLREGCTAIDVGANVGWYTLLFGKMVGAEGRVFSYEPNPKLFELLERTISINGYGDRCRVIEGVASDEATTRTFVIPKGQSGNAHVTVAGSPSGGTVLEVASSTIDSNLADVAEVDLIKIDAEGHESHVLRGAMETIERSPSVKLLVEHHGPGHRRGAALRDEMETLAKITKLGFAIAVLEHDSVLSMVTVEDLPNVPDSEMLYLERVGMAVSVRP